MQYHYGPLGAPATGGTLYLQDAAFPDAVRVLQQVKVGPSDLHILDAADIRPGRHLSPSNHRDSQPEEPISVFSCDPQLTDLIGLDEGKPPM